MVLALSEQDVNHVMDMSEAIEALDSAFRELGSGTAVSRPRTDSSVRHPAGDRLYRFKSMDGVLPSAGVAALRINSDAITFKSDGSNTRYVKLSGRSGMHVAFVIIFDIATGDPIAILPDRNLQRVRVAATSAVAARCLARDDSAVLAVLGSGWQAEAMVPALCAVLPITQVRVYSPTAAHREVFAAQFRDTLNRVDVVPVGSPERAIARADVVAVCTNSLDPIFGWDLVPAGAHLTTIRYPNMTTEVYRRSDIVVTNQRPPAYVRPERGVYPYLHDYVGKGVERTIYGDDSRLDPNSCEYLDFSGYPSLGEVLSNANYGRERSSEVTFHVNNIGVGIQFAALGRHLYDAARAQGIGSEIPTELFLSYQPSMSA